MFLEDEAVADPKDALQPVGPPDKVATNKALNPLDQNPTAPAGPGLHVIQLGPPIEVGATAVQPAVRAVSKFPVWTAAECTHETGGTAVLADSSNPGGIGIQAIGGKLAGMFKGGVTISQDLTVSGVAHFGSDIQIGGMIRMDNADCAEDFDIAEGRLVEPGSVMVLGDEGALCESHRPYDKCVAGVISGAGDYKPGVVLDNQRSSRARQPLALVGKVFCKVDATYGAVKVGDLLTTSGTPGHAMKAASHEDSFGAVIGKALRPLESGRALIPILIALQ